MHNGASYHMSQRRIWYIATDMTKIVRMHSGVFISSMSLYETKQSPWFPGSLGNESPKIEPHCMISCWNQQYASKKSSQKQNQTKVPDSKTKIYKAVPILLGCRQCLLNFRKGPRLVLFWRHPSLCPLHPKQGWNRKILPQVWNRELFGPSHHLVTCILIKGWAVFRHQPGDFVPAPAYEYDDWQMCFESRHLFPTVPLSSPHRVWTIKYRGHFRHAQG